MFHPGKVLRVFSSTEKGVQSADNSTQAYIEMWDENQMMFSVDPKIADKVKSGDIVIVDYSSASMQYPIPKYVVIKILSPEVGKEVWKDYKDYLVKLKEKSMPTQVRSPNYMG